MSEARAVAGGVRFTGAASVVLVVALGCTPQQARSLAEQYALARAMTPWFRPVFVSDLDSAEPFRRRGFSFEPLPSRSSWLDQAGDDAWEEYLRGRVLEIAEAHQADAIVQHHAGWDVDYRTLVAASVAGVAGVSPYSATAVFRQSVEWLTPPGSVVAVVSKGEDALLELDDRAGWHFPRDGAGRYAGYYPADSREAIDMLESSRTQGATHLAFPESSLWWLSFYDELERHLSHRYELVGARSGCGVVYGLRPPATGRVPLRLAWEPWR